MPVLILTAKGEGADKVQGFRLGADDYVTKPFGVLELMARVEALLRRTSRRLPAAGGGNGAAPPVYRFGSVHVDEATRSVLRRGRPVDLAPLEFDLLIALLRRQGAVATRAELLAEVWRYHTGVVSRTVDTHVAILRSKLEDDPTAPRHIITVRKMGYRMET